jgi:hypothetical protein
MHTFSVQSPADSRYLEYVGCRMMLHTVPWCPARSSTGAGEQCARHHSLEEVL